MSQITNNTSLPVGNLIQQHSREIGVTALAVGAVAFLVFATLAPGHLIHLSQAGQEALRAGAVLGVSTTGFALLAISLEKLFREKVRPQSRHEVPQDLQVAQEKIQTLLQDLREEVHARNLGNLVEKLNVTWMAGGGEQITTLKQDVGFKVEALIDEITRAKAEVGACLLKHVPLDTI